MAAPRKVDAKAAEPAEEQREEPKQAPEAETSKKEVEAAKTSASESLPDEEKPATEEVTEVSETPEKAEKPAETEKLTEEEKKQLSDKAQKRYRHLSEKSRKAEARAAELEKEVEKLRATQEKRFTSGIQPFPLGTQEKPPAMAVSQEEPSIPATEKLPWEPQAPATPAPAGEVREISEEDYKRDVIQTADYIIRARLGQFEKSNEIKTDLKDVESKYPELNPDSSEYSEEMSNKLSKLFEAQLRAAPGTRLKTFVTDIMSLRKSGEEKGKAEVTAKVVEQKAEEAVSPSEVAPPAEKSFEEMTLEEKEQYMKEHGLW